MKKIFVLILISIGISCSKNDDDATNTADDIYGKWYCCKSQKPRQKRSNIETSRLIKEFVI